MLCKIIKEKESQSFKKRIRIISKVDRRSTIIIKYIWENRIIKIRWGNRY